MADQPKKQPRPDDLDWLRQEFRPAGRQVIGSLYVWDGGGHQERENSSVRRPRLRLSERPVIGDELREVAAWCELGSCIARYADPGALGFADVAARAFAAELDATAMFKLEAMCLARLSHPGITKVYDYCEAAPPFLVMELVDGPSLVLAAGSLAPWQALDVVAQVATALEASHPCRRHPSRCQAGQPRDGIGHAGQADRFRHRS